MQGIYEQFLNNWQSSQQAEAWTNPWLSPGPMGDTAVQQSMAMQRQWAEQFAGLFGINDAARAISLGMVESTSNLCLASLESQVEWWRSLTAFWVPTASTTRKTAPKRTPAAREPEPLAEPAEVKLEVVASAPQAVESENASAAADPDAKDDLKLIAGIGPGLERKLNDEGIFNFRQIAAFTKSDIARLEKTVIKFPGRIERDGWVEQAKKLAAQ